MSLTPGAAWGCCDRAGLLLMWLQWHAGGAFFVPLFNILLQFSEWQYHPPPTCPLRTRMYSHVSHWQRLPQPPSLSLVLPNRCQGRNGAVTGYHRRRRHRRRGSDTAQNPPLRSQPAAHRLRLGAHATAAGAAGRVPGCAFAAWCAHRDLQLSLPLYSNTRARSVRSNACTQSRCMHLMSRMQSCMHRRLASLLHA